MHLNRSLIISMLFLVAFAFTAQKAFAQDNIIQPSEFFSGFPEIKWNMNIDEAKKAIEKTGARAARPADTQLTWISKFDNEDGQGMLVFDGGKQLSDITVQLYYSDKGKQMYESWLKKLTEKHGETKEGLATEDVTSKIWKFKTGFSIELRLVKGEGENRYMTDIHWVKL